MIRRIFVFTILAMNLGPAFTFADSEATERPAASKRNVNMTVDTKDWDAQSMNERTEPEDRFGIFFDESTALGFNEDGDPALKREF
jgi:hypothetical protein